MLFRFTKEEKIEFFDILRSIDYSLMKIANLETGERPLSSLNKNPATEKDTKFSLAPIVDEDEIAISVQKENEDRWNTVMKEKGQIAAGQLFEEDAMPVEEFQ